MVKINTCYFEKNKGGLDDARFYMAANSVIQEAAGSMEKNISTSTYSFEKLREGGFVYVDKTKYIYSLIKPETAQVFCARPRRFGKSLMISTLEALFQGRRALFHGLYIDTDPNVTYQWERYPVIHLNLAGCNAATPERLEAWLKNAVHKASDEYDICVEDNYAEIMFSNLIDKLVSKTGKRVVLLVDEYDKPLTDNIDNPIIDAIRSELEGFYGVIKAQEENLRFTFLTGVTKFSQVSIFSKLNNLSDISMDQSNAAMFGYTEEELQQYFQDRITEAVQNGVKDTDGNPLDDASFLSAVRSHYDGFCFYPGSEKVYNPVSIGKFFNGNCLFKNYWFETATPSFLVELARKKPLYLTDTSHLIISDSGLSAFNIQDFQNPTFSRMQLIELLFQTGYLTIAGWAPNYGTADLFYQLRFPNDEVSLSFDRLLVRAYTGLDEGDSMVYVQRMISSAFTGDTSQLIALLKTFFSGFSYNVDKPDEGHFQTIVYCIFKLCGMHVIPEETTNIGRIDAVLHAGAHLYIIEFKFNQSAGKAVEQIEQKEYADKYILPAHENGQAVHLLGINFSIRDRNIIDDYQEVIIT